MSFKIQYTEKLTIELLVVLFALGISFFPLLFNLPFRDNIYLSWEGAYRIANGDIPFKDFYMPFGYGYFIFIALFFKLFGSGLTVLLWAQAFLNTLFLFVFYRLILLFDIKREIALISTFVMGLTYTFLFFWPWYNQTAFFFNLVALYFACLAVLKEKRSFLHAVLAGVFAFLAFFTKQDYGGLALVFVLFLFLVNLFFGGSVKSIGTYLASFALTAALFILPVYNQAFSYWFNLGQAPHESRIDISRLLTEVFAGSEWEKLVLLIVGILLIYKWKVLLKDKKKFFFYTLVLIILAETIITKETSRLPKDTTTYFYGFFFALFLTELFSFIDFKKLKYGLTLVCLIFFLFSSKYWSYANRILKFKSTGTAKTTSAKPSYVWASAPFLSFNKVYLPKPTITGIKEILALNLPSNPKVLNMSELTMLAKEIPYEPLKKVPLWYHLHVGIFDKQVEGLREAIEKGAFDLVLFEDIPNLDNFYPYALQTQLRKSYKLVTVFPAPRKDGNSFIEVYIKYAH